VNIGYVIGLSLFWRIWLFPENAIVYSMPSYMVKVASVRFHGFRFYITDVIKNPAVSSSLFNLFSRFPLLQYLVSSLLIMHKILK
jgi:hypothetical protein